jgi:hypothetical protein
MSTSRRKFLKSAAAAAAVAAATVATLPSFAHADQQQDGSLPGDGPKLETSSTQVFKITVRADLSGSGVDLELQPGQLSEPVDLGNKGVFRVSCTPLNRATPFGPVYSLALTDVNGNAVAQMNIGSNTTATFTRLGVQVYMLSFDASAQNTG